MNRLIVSRTAIFFSIIGLIYGAEGLRADVLEVGGSDYRWITRQANTSQLMTPVIDASPIARLVTLVDLSAGPESWRSHIAYLSVKYDISPLLLEALVWQESRWRSGAISPVGARGLAQLMPGTARQLGVDLDDPRANLEGGARYLREQLDRFGGNVENALAAYNAGPGRVLKSGGIPAIRETQNYVASIMSRLSNEVRRK